MDEPHTDLRLTPTGITAGLTALTATLGGLITFSGPVFSAGLAGFVIIGLSRLLASRHLSRVNVSRTLPARARAGESFAVKTTIHPGNRFPGEMNISFSDPVSALIKDRRMTLTNRHEISLRYTGKSMARGPLHPGKWTIHSTWPLGFFSVKRFGYFHDSHSLILLPKPYLPGKLRRHLHALARESGNRSLEPSDPSSEFRLLREFRAGDPVRSIHWPGSLRTSRLQVSELEPPRPKPRSFGILIHSYSPPGQLLTPGTFEMLLRIATGLLLRFKSEEIPVLFSNIPQQMVTLKNKTLFDAQLDSLALIRRTPLHSLSPLLHAAEDFQQCDEVFVLSDCPKSEWEAPLQSLFKRCTCIDVSSLKRNSVPELPGRRGIS